MTLLQALNKSMSEGGDGKGYKTNAVAVHSIGIQPFHPCLPEDVIGAERLMVLLKPQGGTTAYIKAENGEYYVRHNHITAKWEKYLKQIPATTR